MNCEKGYVNDKHVRRVDERLREKQNIVPLEFFVIKNVRNRISNLSANRDFLLCDMK